MALRLSGIQACVFDAYGTLFDVHSAADRAQDSVGAKWRELAELWRTKQLQYTWLRSLSGHYEDFFHVTGDALDFAMPTSMTTPTISDRRMPKRACRSRSDSVSVEGLMLESRSQNRGVCAAVDILRIARLPRPFRAIDHTAR